MIISKLNKVISYQCGFLVILLNFNYRFCDNQQIKQGNFVNSLVRVFSYITQFQLQILRQLINQIRQFCKQFSAGFQLYSIINKLSKVISQIVKCGLKQKYSIVFEISLLDRLYFEYPIQQYRLAFFVMYIIQKNISKNKKIKNNNKQKNINNLIFLDGFLVRKVCRHKLHRIWQKIRAWYFYYPWLNQYLKLILRNQINLIQLSINFNLNLIFLHTYKYIFSHIFSLTIKYYLYVSIERIGSYFSFQYTFQASSFKFNPFQKILRDFQQKQFNKLTIYKQVKKSQVYFILSYCKRVFGILFTKLFIIYSQHFYYMFYCFYEQ
eukprot:TRINITY_DN3558_c0_g1_i10.p2 TRINITY_DN3558_c0_g1~~TRINITY_DN3558_c0_g1_i10.p2  ORF type:complete len:323 (-),score=-19.30 TRINITY_DN3558_c0_g1_i10:605-1573(-)